MGVGGSLALLGSCRRQVRRGAGGDMPAPVSYSPPAPPRPPDAYTRCHVSGNKNQAGSPGVACSIPAGCHCWWELQSRIQSQVE